jgi:outer membrane protein insertion porin family
VQAAKCLSRLILIVLFLTPFVRAEDSGGLVLKEIQIQGLKRIEKDAVLEKLKNKAGKPYQVSWVHEEIQSLYNMGFFDEVEVQSEAEAGGLSLFTWSKKGP